MPTRDGAWHQSPTVTMDVPAFVRSVNLSLSMDCTPCQTSGVTGTVNLDDVQFTDGAPTAVTVRSFRRSR